MPRKQCEHNIVLPRGIICDRGYLFIRLFPKDKGGKPFIKGCGIHTLQSEKIAKLLCNRFREQIYLGKFGEYLEDLTIKSMKIVPLANLYVQHCEVKEKDTVRRIVENVIKPSFGGYEFEKVTPAHIKEWRNKRLLHVSSKTGTMLAFSTVNREQSVISAFFSAIIEWAKTEAAFLPKIKLPTENPCSYVEKPTESARKRTRVMSPEEWDRLKPYLSDKLTDHCLMALHSSLRLKDISSLSGKQISAELIKGLQAKTDFPYELPMTESLYSLVKRIASRPLYQRYAVARDFSPACEKAGIKDLTFRDLRRTSLTWLDKLGTRITTIRDRAGHADLKTTNGYLVTNLDEQREGIKKLESVFK